VDLLPGDASAQRERQAAANAAGGGRLSGTAVIFSEFYFGADVVQAVARRPGWVQVS